MLSKLEKDYLIDLLEKGQNIPEDFKYKLFPVEHKEYELAYAGKMRKEDLLADDDGSFPVPLQIEKVFNGEEHPTFAKIKKPLFQNLLQMIYSTFQQNLCRDSQQVLLCSDRIAQFF